MSAAIGVVLDALDLGNDAIFVATKVDDPVVLLMTTTPMTVGDVAIIIAASSFTLGLDQGLMGRPL